MDLCSYRLGLQLNNLECINKWKNFLIRARDMKAAQENQISICVYFTDNWRLYPTERGT